MTGGKKRLKKSQMKEDPAEYRTDDRMKESKTLEFKESVTATFLKTVSAFSNYGTGEIKFGIDDNGKIVGIDDPEEVCLDIENRINDSITPGPDYSLAVESGTGVITLTVREGIRKPYFYRSKAYRRNNTSTVEVDTFELTRLILEGQNRTYDSLKADRQDFSFDYLEKALKSAAGIRKMSRDILRTLNIYSENDGFNIAGSLLADRNDFCGIDIARFGENNDIILDRETLDGLSLPEQFEKAVSVYRRYYQYDVIDGLSRRTEERIPEKAFREALANSLVHRTWDVRAHIRIAMYDKKIEIISPGGLPKGMTEEEYLDGRISVLRNPILANIFFRLHYIECFGTGITRIRSCYEKSMMKPTFEFSENAVKVTLPEYSSDEKTADLTADEAVVYRLLKNGRKMTSSALAEKTGYGKTKTLKILKNLSERQLIVVTGTGRGTKYEIRR